MSNRLIIKYIIILFASVLFNSCTDLFINDEHEYNSIRFSEGGWIEFQSADISEILSDEDFSFQIWISGDSNVLNLGTKALLCILDDSNDKHFAIYRNTSYNNQIIVHYDGISQTIVNDAIDWNVPEFTMLTITSNATSNRVKIYINKEEVTLGIDPLGLDFDFNTGNSNLAIGARVYNNQTLPDNFWNGYIDEMRLWKKELTAEKIEFHFNNPTKLTFPNCSDPQYTTQQTCTDEVADTCSDPQYTTQGTCTNEVADTCSDGAATGSETEEQCNALGGGASWGGGSINTLTWGGGAANTLTWETGTYSDFYIYDENENIIDNILSGLWRFNYEEPRISIPDESCQELNLGNGASGDISCTNINGTVYTLPGYQVEFSNFGL